MDGRSAEPAGNAVDDQRDEQVVGRVSMKDSAFLLEAVDTVFVFVVAKDDLVDPRRDLFDSR